MAGRGRAGSVSVAAALVAELRFGALPLDPPPRRLVDAGVGAALAAAGSRSSTPAGAIDPVAATALVGAGAGWLVGSRLVAAHLTCGASELGATTRAIGDALALGDQRRARRLLDRLALPAVTASATRPPWPHELATPPVRGAGPGGGDGRVWADDVLDAVARACTATVVAPAVGAALGGAPGAGAAYALVAARPTRRGTDDGRPGDPPLLAPPRALATVTAIAIAAARPSRATAVRRAVATASASGAPLDQAALAAALGLTDDDGHPHRPAEPGDVAAAGRLVGDVTLALAVLLVAADAAWTIGRATVSGLARRARRRR